ncbi:sulfonate ABC transporter substrate-binding protein [Heyndrickxia coagulans]|nr:MULTISPECIES: sulfonate ABC transporter substrate-binding protein [Heyndrickxia]NWN94112.1 sulfonate ABC transporter substrate-binding protein [Bacillus sp. (in: firmicutes)]AJO21780.1 ABC transporter substrate-binding protein [Heyndrickxia coagulans]ATW82264.1 sulfonate ABC transporter substrate-binding protein [Heyndrickxia coagulans]AVD57075.1 sulfonate ABC transporter substrate-binding protein [Heyndrickxia coagulans]AWP38012.1 sulfonate ABC transporter substrate-binding protein [Heyndr
MKGSVFSMMKNLNKRVCFMLFSFILVFALLAACSNHGKKENKTAQTVKSENTIKIGYQKNCPLLILKASGTLEKRLKPLGVKVEWYEFQSGTALLESLNSGNIDFGRTGDSPPIFAQASGSNLKYVGVGKSKYEGAAILVKKNSTIRSVADLKGKKVGFAKGSSSHYFLVKALEKNGLSYKDITPAYLQPGDARVAFEQGTIDAWVIWDPFTADAEVTGHARTLVTGEGYTTDRDYFLATPAYLKKHEKIVQIVLDEVKKSSAWANEHPAELTELLSKALGIDQKAIKIAVDRREYGLDPFTPAIIQEQQQIADKFYELKLIPKKVNVKDNIYHFKKDEGK